MRMNITPRVVADSTVIREFKDHAQQVNALSEGRMVASYNAVPSVPTTGAYAVGDFVRNSAPAESGSPGSKFVLLGWLCVVGGDPATFVPIQPPTGN